MKSPLFTHCPGQEEALSIKNILTEYYPLSKLLLKYHFNFGDGRGNTMINKTNRRVLIASLVGSSIEWFDYFLYGTMAALVFNQLFFVSENPKFVVAYDTMNVLKI